MAAGQRKTSPFPCLLLFSKPWCCSGGKHAHILELNTHWRNLRWHREPAADALTEKLGVRHHNSTAHKNCLRKLAEKELKRSESLFANFKAKFKTLQLAYLKPPKPMVKTTSRIVQSKLQKIKWVGYGLHLTLTLVRYKGMVIQSNYKVSTSYTSLLPYHALEFFYTYTQRPIQV